MVEKPKRIRVSLTLPQYYVNALNTLIELGIFMEPQDCIRSGLRLIFEKYGLEPFKKPENTN